ncbi:MAG: hypothetical protein JWO78_2450 [Micavibrio sp.]|nr:hypothetical protein [Micavibrio sp.]
MAQSDRIMSDDFNGINPLAAPALYSLHYGKKHQDSVTVLAHDGSLMALEKLAHLEDKRTGFYADVMIDRSQGHAVILYKGMDVPFKNEGNGRTGFLRDAFTAAQSLITGAKNWQTPFAEKIYLDTINNPDVKSVEVVGFSLGTLHANYIAAKYGVKGTVLADLGIANRGLKNIFNDNARDVDAAKNHLKNNLTDLRMELDPVSWLGFFRHRGNVIGLDRGRNPDPEGILHLSENYNKNAQKLMTEKPHIIAPDIVYAGAYKRTPAPGLA